MASESKGKGAVMIDDPESFGGYFPFECTDRMELLGILCITIDRAAYIISKDSYLEEHWAFDIPEDELYKSWVEFLTKAVEKGTLRAVAKKFDVSDKINVHETVVDLYDLQEWLDDRDVTFNNDVLEEVIQERIKLLHKTDAFIKIESLCATSTVTNERVELLSERLENALSENRRLQNLISVSFNDNGMGDIAGQGGSKKSESASLNIIGALCEIYWKSKNPEKPKIIQSEIIEALSNYDGFAGLSERNLKDKLGKAIKAIRFE
ncbi:hypothetical protein RCH09_003966 [Actimicrobium sp. GrIS 1.19]|uniref:hypothetical protein n=1 Tax=Actimicrobium sp. GrIS 1.19 TaxID=3071708 RepID=UPI002E03BD56|nr:hypothetical protein [Actimicrobium sp. GrIS 1.19]